MLVELVKEKRVTVKIHPLSVTLAGFLMIEMRISSHRPNTIKSRRIEVVVVVIPEIASQLLVLRQ
jgi:hypothetical protein